MIHNYKYCIMLHAVERGRTDNIVAVVADQVS